MSREISRNWGELGADLGSFRKYNIALLFSDTCGGAVLAPFGWRNLDEGTAVAGCGCDGCVPPDGNPQLTQTANMMSNHALLLPLVQGWGRAVRKRLVGAQDLVHQQQQDVRDRNHGRSFFPSRLTGDPPELLFQKAVLLERGRPSAFRQSTSQPRIAPQWCVCFCFSPHCGCCRGTPPPTN